MEVLDALINASERAAAVARACCSDSKDEGALLIAEKGAGEANARFDHDFKTIADVLAQESARTEIRERCPLLGEHVRGEECTEIGGVRVEIMESVDETAQCLHYLVPMSAAMRMAEAAHSTPKAVLTKGLGLPPLDSSELGVWIDPIDATSEFIAGAKGEAEPGHGLSCVTVLIGAYLRSTGEPLIGVINQPFYNEGKGRIIWGFSYDGTNKCNTNFHNDTSYNTILTSSAENPEIVKKFQDAEWKVNSVPGAGHKLLKVALGESSAYIVSKGTTFRWDTCAPHAILRAQGRGGDILSLKTRTPLKYNDPLNVETQKYCNNDGIIAYADESVFHDIEAILK